MPSFEDLMNRAKSQAQLEPDSHYWRGYIHGLWRDHYGQDISPGDGRTEDYRNGHGDGLCLS